MKERCNNLKNTGHVDGIIGVFRDVLSNIKEIIVNTTEISIQNGGYRVILTEDGHWYFDDITG